MIINQVGGGSSGQKFANLPVYNKRGTNEDTPTLTLTNGVYASHFFGTNCNYQSASNSKYTFIEKSYDSGFVSLNPIGHLWYESISDTSAIPRIYAGSFSGISISSEIQGSGKPIYFKTSSATTSDLNYMTPASAITYPYIVENMKSFVLGPEGQPADLNVFDARIGHFNSTGLVRVCLSSLYVDYEVRDGDVMIQSIHDKNGDSIQFPDYNAGGVWAANNGVCLITLDESTTIEVV